MKDAAWRPDELMTAIVWLGVGMGRFGGRSSAYLPGSWTGEKPARGEVSGREVLGACLSLRGGGSASCWGRGLIVNADLGVAEGMEGCCLWGEG